MILSAGVSKWEELCQVDCHERLPLDFSFWKSCQNFLGHRLRPFPRLKPTSAMVRHINRKLDSLMLLVLRELALKVESLWPFEDKQMNSMVPLLHKSSNSIASRQ